MQEIPILLTTLPAFTLHLNMNSLPADEEAQQKLQLLLEKSVAVAAAFVRDSSLYSLDDADSDGAAASTSGSSSGEMGEGWWSLLPWAGVSCAAVYAPHV